jgi:hypothetical protein
VRLACQEHLLPGATLIDKWDFARQAGFDGIELRGAGDFAFRARLPELKAARRAGVVMPSVCRDMDHFIGDFDAERRRDAVSNLRSQLSVIAELDGLGVMTPAAYGLWSNRLPPFADPPRSPDGDRGCWARPSQPSASMPSTRACGCGWNHSTAMRTTWSTGSNRRLRSCARRVSAALGSCSTPSMRTSRSVIPQPPFSPQGR